MTGHTPGQWRLADDWQQSGVILANDEVRIPVGTVATLIGFSSRSPAELEANGHLIAAAPQLLEVLQDLVIEASRRHGDLNAVIEKALAVIDLAEGNSDYSYVRRPGERQLPSITARQPIGRDS